VVGLLVGVPLGIVVGRALWGRFADTLDVVSQPHTPFAALLGIAIAAFVVANVVAAIPARAARRVAPSRALQSE